MSPLSLNSNSPLIRLKTALKMTILKKPQVFIFSICNRLNPCSSVGSQQYCAP